MDLLKVFSFLFLDPNWNISISRFRDNQTLQQNCSRIIFTSFDKPSMAVNITQLRKGKKKMRKYQLSKGAAADTNFTRKQASDKAMEMASKEIGSK